MRTVSIPALIITAVVAFAAVACSPAAPGSTPGPTSPGSGPTASPAGPTANPTANPTPTAVAGGPTRVELDLADDRDVVALINDLTGGLVEARSGSAGASMSVRWFDSIVENASPESIELTWVGLPRDEEIGIEVEESSDGLVVTITQASPPLNSDAEGSDRVLVLTFEEAVSADDVKVEFVASPAA